MFPRLDAVAFLNLSIRFNNGKSASVLERMKKTILPNGMTLITDKRPSKSVAIVITVKVGSCNETARNAGISHLIDHVLAESTKNRSKEQIENEVARLGGEINSESSTQVCSCWIQILSRHFDTALDIIADVMQNPLFKKEDIQKEKKIILEEISMTHDDMDHWPAILLRKMLFKKHLAKNSIIGTKKSVKALTRKDLVGYYKRYYIPNNMVISIVGNINYADVKRKVKKAFSGFKRGKLPTVKKVKEPIQTKPQKKVEKRKISSSYIALGFKTVKGSDKDCFVLDVINAILVKPGTTAGRLMEKIRGRGLAYSVEVESIGNIDYGYFTIYADTDKKNISLVKDIILKELRLENLTAKEIEDAKGYFIGAYILENEDTYEWANTLAYFETIKDANLAKDLVKEIKKVTKKDILRVAKKYFKNHTMVVVQQK